MIGAAGGRCTGLHHGTYDYSASLGISAGQQSMEHPAADHAKAVMQVAAASTGVQLSEARPASSRSTSPTPSGRLAAPRPARPTLARPGVLPGLGPAALQLPTRCVATFAFYRNGFPASVDRLQAHLRRADSGFLDEPATARALAWLVARGLDGGAVSEDEVMDDLDLDAAGIRALAHPRRTG